MNQQVRFILFIAISVGILITWQAFFAPKPKPKGPEAPVATGEQKPPELAPGTPPGTVVPAPAPAPGAGEEAEPASEKTTIETELWTAVFDSKGAGLESFVLKGKKQQKHSAEGVEGFNLVHPSPTQGLPLAVEVGPVKATDGYRLASKSDGSLQYERTKAGWTVTKTFHFAKDSYRLGLDVQVKRADGVQEAAPVTLQYPAFEANPQTSGMFSRAEIHQAVCFHPGDRSMETRHYKTQEKPPVTVEPAMFGGLDEKYFLAAMAPAAGQDLGKCVLTAPQATELVASYVLPLAKDGSAKFDLYLGPKATELLQAWGHEADVSIYDGSIAKAGKLLLPILKFFHDVAKNWGVAIILLTLLVKVVTFPLAHRQMKSMEAMKLLGPKMEEIKKKYENDPQKQNVETMRLYKEHNINPVGCAVPMLVQMPIWWALYSTLQNSFELYNEPFLGWIHDLTAHDPYYILPVLMTATMIITQVLTPQTSPQAQQMKGMTYGMPVFFGFMMISLPAGLVLYIFTNNLLSIAQSLWFRRMVAKTPPAAG